MSKRRQRPTNSANVPTASGGRSSHLDKRFDTPQRVAGRRRTWLLAGILLALLPLWWCVTAVASRADRQLIEQGMAELNRNPRLAEELLQLVQAGDQPAVLAGLTEARARQQHWSEAEEAARQWTRVAPNSIAAWRTLAEVERQQQKIVSCRNSLERAVALTGVPAELDALHAQIFQLCLLTDDAAAARAHLERIVDDRAREAQRNSLSYAQLLRLEGQLSEARELVSKHIAADRRSAAALMLRGIIELDEGNYAAAQSDLAEVVALQADNKEAHYKLAVALRALGQSEAARHHFEVNQRLTSQTAAAER